MWTVDPAGTGGPPATWRTRSRKAEQGLAGRPGGDAARLLAVRRAALTLYCEAAEVCDDSYGGLGDMAGDAIAE